MLKRLRTVIPGEDSIYARTIGREAYYAEYRARLQPHPADAELPETPSLEGYAVQESCDARKWGEYNALRCCYPAQHAGEHNYVVAR